MEDLMGIHFTIPKTNIGGPILSAKVEIMTSHSFSSNELFENLITNLSPSRRHDPPTKVGYLERFFGQHALQFSCCETIEVEGEVRKVQP